MIGIRIALLLSILAGLPACAGAGAARFSVDDLTTEDQEPLPRPGRSPQDPASRDIDVGEEQPGGWSTTVTMGLGYRVLRSRVRDAELTMGTTTLEVFVRPSGWLLGGELGFATGESSRAARFSFNSELSNRVYELYLGPRLSASLSEGAEVFVGGGGAAVWFLAEAETDEGGVVSDDAVDLGLYGHAGFMLTMSGVEWVLDGRFAGGMEMDLFGEELDLGYWQIGVGGRVSF